MGEEVSNLLSKVIFYSLCFTNTNLGYVLITFFLLLLLTTGVSITSVRSLCTGFYVRGFTSLSKFLLGCLQFFHCFQYFLIVLNLLKSFLHDLDFFINLYFLFGIKSYC